ncbi:MAG: hypothetical protein R6X34_29145 [Chloroflexota bacterium]
MQKTAVLTTKDLCRKRPFSPQKVYAENGRSHHKRSMQKTAVPASKGLCRKRPFSSQKVYAAKRPLLHNSQLAQTTLLRHDFHLA